MNAVDLFAGAGGMTLGAEQAGFRVHTALNHWQAAVDCHAANHPRTTHICQDAHQADFTQLRPFDALLAAPSCQGHSHARGKDRPHHDAARATAWAVVTCAEVHRPALIVCENVPAWAKWTLWPAWCSAMTALGYAVSPNIVDAANYGCPQNRVRLIVVCTRSKHPLVLRERAPRQQRAIGPLIDWDGGGWRKIDKTLAPNTLARITRGRTEFGERFVMPYYGNGSGLTGRSIDRPVGTITTRDRWAVVRGDHMRMFSVDECRKAQTFPDRYKLPANRKDATMLIGNATPPWLAREVLLDIRMAA